jgi:hypothetical protein
MLIAPALRVPSTVQSIVSPSRVHCHPTLLARRRRERSSNNLASFHFLQQIRNLAGFLAASGKSL